MSAIAADAGSMSDAAAVAEEAPQLPLELLPHILHALQWRTRDLAACSAVSRTWHRYATPLLYARLFLRNQQRLLRVFATLHDNAQLAALVRVLEIRVFPFALHAEPLEALEASMLRTLQNAVNLEALHWTRTGSLTDRVIPFLPPLPKLQTLELTGSSRFYTPANVARYMLSEAQTPQLRHFSVVLPDRDVANALPAWAEAMGAKLQSFSVLCQHSALVSDETLSAMAHHLTGLTRLSVAGCKVVTADGILAMLRGTNAHIRDLAIEGLALHPASFSMLSPFLAELRCLSLTFPRQNLCPVAEFWQYLSVFVESLPSLVEFTHYTSSWNTPKGTYSETLDSDEDGEAAAANGAADDASAAARARVQGSSSSSTTPQEYRRHELEEHAQSGRPIVREPKLSSAFLRRLIAARGTQLHKLRIHGIVATMEQVEDISFGCPNLQDLVLHLYEGEKDVLQRALARLTQLRSLHIISSLYSDLYLSEDTLRNIAAHCSVELRQIGFRNRVWLVERISDADATRQSTDSRETGISQAQQQEQTQVSVPLNDGRHLVLRRWDMSAGTFPEVLLVVRACEWLLRKEAHACDKDADERYDGQSAK